MPHGTTAAGDVVWIRKRRWRIERLRLTDRLRVLDVVSAGGEGIRRTFLTPFDRAWPEGGRERLRRVRWPHARARLLACAARAGGWRMPLAALDAGVEILPFQLEGALAFLDGARRVLVADAVGLGKTVQAGLIIAETMRRAANACVLVLVPAAIRDQWAGELARRFGIASEAADAETLQRLSLDLPRGTSPWHPGVWIATADFVKQAHVFDALPLWPWDLVVIDEAHEAAGRSDRHAACDAIARRARRVLLLTATPHNGDAAAFERLRNLGRSPGLPASIDDVTILRRTPEGLGWTGRRRVRWHRVAPSPAERAALDALLAFERDVLRTAGPERHAAALLLLSVLRKRALSTMAALAASLRRRAACLDGSAALTDAADRWSQPRLDFDETDGDGLTGDDEAALGGDVGLDRRREDVWLRRLTTLADRAAGDESRVRRVADLVVRSREPVVVFTEFRDSLTALAARIGRVAAMAAMHGGQTAGERRAALSSYLEGAATVLLATDVAGQGLNLQTRGRWIINADLPWNPARLAQRAGRVDRIGQTRPVHVTLLSSQHPAESDLLRRLAARAVRAGNAIGGGFDHLAWPDERAIGAAVVTGLDPPVREGPVIDPDISRQRQARWTARELVRRRLWALRWRDTDGKPARPMIARARGASIAPRTAWVLIFSTPIVDGAGSVLETHLGAYRVTTAGAPPPVQRIVEAVGPYAAGRAERRAVRVRRLLNRRVDRSAAVTSAIARELRAVQTARSPQPGLFDRSSPIGRAAPGPSRLRTADRPQVAAGRVALVAAIVISR